jgi:hypothetical protein
MSKLNDTTHNIIVEALAAGNYRQVAAELAGIGRTTLYSWLERGEADYEAGVESDYAALWSAIQVAEANAENEAIKAIRAAAPKDWRAAAWMLEHRHQTRWGGKTTVEHTGTVRHELSELSQAELEAMAGALMERRGAA